MKPTGQQILSAYELSLRQDSVINMKLLGPELDQTVEKLCSKAGISDLTLLNNDNFHQTPLYRELLSLLKT